MTVFRTIMGVLVLLFAAGWLGCVLLFVLRDDNRLNKLGTKLRHYTALAVLTWFNLEIWGQVVWTLVTWP